MVDDPLLRAIIEDPDDDAPRLVYADWLDENGEPARAAFVRAQVKLARVAANDPDRRALVQTERTLWRAHREEWTAWVPDWATPRMFRRGFLEAIRCDAKDFVSRADEVRRYAPIAEVRLDRLAKVAVAVFQSRVLDGLRSLTLSYPISSGALQLCAQSSYLGRLAQLNLSSIVMPGEIVASLLSSSAFPMLRSLRLRRCTMGDEHTSALVKHRWVTRLKNLDLSHNHIYIEGGEAILASSHLNGIESLDLRGNPLSENWAVANALRESFGSRVRLRSAG